MKQILLLLLTTVLSGLSQAQVQAPLRLSLPEDGIAYLRLMGQDGAAGKESRDRLREVLQRLGKGMNLRAALAADLEQRPELVQQHPWLELLQLLEAPAELTVLWPTGATPAQARILARGRSRLASEEALNQALARFSGAVHGLQLVSGFDGQHIAALRWDDRVDLFLVLDPASRVFYLLAGENVTQEELQDRVAGLTLQPEHPMLTLEKRIDSTGAGPFLWLDMPRALYAWTLYAKPALEVRQRMGMFAGMRAAALGWGRRDGKGRMSLVVDAPRNMGLASFLPAVSNDYSDLASRGEPEWLLSLNVPGQALLQMAEGVQDGTPESAQAFQQRKADIADSVGISLERLVAALGPEIVMFGDRAGSFLAVRNNDPEAADKLLAYVTANYSVADRMQEFGGRAYHHLKLEMLPEPAGKSDRDPLDDYVQAVLSRDHIYWVRDGKWLLFSHLPQPLFDRYRLDDPVVLDDWLKTRQRQQADHALLLVSARMDDIPRTLYYAYLSVYQGLADMLHIPFDPFDFPGAVELNLPASGGYGVELNLEDPYLSLEFSFEDNPLEALSGGNAATSAAMAGILAAIAIPAYKDYLNRSSVAQAINLSSSVKAAIASYHAGTGYLPPDAQTAGIDTQALLSGQDAPASLEVIDGAIVIAFKGDSPDMAGKTLSLMPYAAAGKPGVGLVWRCGNAPRPENSRKNALTTAAGKAPVYRPSNLSPRYLPANCR